MDLTQRWARGRSVTGDSAHFTGGAEPFKLVDSSGHRTHAGNGFQEPQSAAFTVHPGTLLDAENSILAATKSGIAEFESFKDRVLSEESWIFFAEDKSSTVPSYHAGHYVWQGDERVWKQPDTYADVKDPNPGQTADLQGQQNSLLQAVGGAIQLVGVFVGKLNDAAQIYAEADKQSWADAYDVPMDDGLHTPGVFGTKTAGGPPGGGETHGHGAGEHAPLHDGKNTPGVFGTKTGGDEPDHIGKLSTPEIFGIHGGHA
ncbi:hypothetical protein GCM10012284_10840 [Mangrovihabitans endophyticus]|uniref:Uncharacterized protein n=1 Tax=Mangrovihabitans endophyticus TaxID=1751298 RepID=A0A8J3BXF6_9ACTN|nr:hypothetical protein GCM10012284_10840 [Mangrovihabitans endophyticus]